MKRFVDGINPVNNRVDQDRNEYPLPLAHEGIVGTPTPPPTAVIDLPLQCDEESSHRTNMGCLSQNISTREFLQLQQNRASFSTAGTSNCSVASRLGKRRKIMRNLFHVWDNQMALKLFGTRKRILEEQERQESISHWVIHPCSKFRYDKINVNKTYVMIYYS